MSNYSGGLTFQNFWKVRSGFYRVKDVKGIFLHNTSPKKIERLNVVGRYYILNLEFKKIGPKTMTALSFLLYIIFKNNFVNWTGITWTQIFKEWDNEVRKAQNIIASGGNIICLEKDFLTPEGFSYLAEGLIEAVQKGYLFVIPMQNNDVIYFPNKFLIQSIIDEDKANRARNLKL